MNEFYEFAGGQTSFQAKQTSRLLESSAALPAMGTPSTLAMLGCIFRHEDTWKYGSQCSCKGDVSVLRQYDVPNPVGSFNSSYLLDQARLEFNIHFASSLSWLPALHARPQAQLAMHGAARTLLMQPETPRQESWQLRTHGRASPLAPPKKRNDETASPPWTWAQSPLMCSKIRLAAVKPIEAE